MVLYEGSYVVIGGTSGSSSEVYNNCESWNQTLTWAKFPPLCKGRKNLTATVFGKSIYVFSGMNSQKIIMNTIEKFDGNSWSIIDTRLPLQIDSPATHTYANEILVLGQRKGELNEETKERGVCLIFNPDKGDIHFLPDLNRNRKCGSGNTMIIGQKLVVFGGFKKDGEYLDLSNPGYPW